jgi:hypothetical protein
VNLKFDQLIKEAETPAKCWRALQDYVDAQVSAKLFTVMTVDMERLLAQRVYTNDPIAYPISGTKPITLDRWFDVVHRQQKMFVANTIAEIADVFPDYEKIRSLGCGSVVNLPVIIEGELAATINLLHQEHYYTPERVRLISSQLSKPAKLAYLCARSLSPVMN